MSGIAEQDAKRHLRAELQAVPEHVRTVRNTIDVTLYTWGFAQLIDDARVIASELFTNAVKAAYGQTVALYLAHRDGQLRVCVWDPSPADPVMGPIDDEAEWGRGLFIVAALASAHGHYRDPGIPGKFVWATLKAGGLDLTGLA